MKKANYFCYDRRSAQINTGMGIDCRSRAFCYSRTLIY